MTLEQFWGSTWREVQLYRLAAERKALSEDRRLRVLAYTIYKFCGQPKDPVSINSFMPLPGDVSKTRIKKDANTPYLSVDELAANLKKHFNERGN
jgi:hypothetical protein